MKKLWFFFLTLSHAFVALSQSELLSGQAPQSVTAAGNSFAPQFSSDGKTLSFASHAKNLTTNSFSGLNLNLFQYDLRSSNIVLISASLSGTNGGDEDSAFVSASSNGQFTAFISAAANLAANDTNGNADIFVRDTSTGNTRLVTFVTYDGSAPPEPNPGTSQPLSSNPEISADGRWVAFASRSPDLIQTPVVSTQNVFVHDTLSNRTILASVTVDGNASDALSHSPRISADGRYVTFMSTATNLVFPPTPAQDNVFVRDLQQESTVCLTADLGSYLNADANNYKIVDHSLSRDGRVAAFKITNLRPPLQPRSIWTFRRDVTNDSSLLLTTNGNALTSPRLSSDGRFLAYESETNLFVWDQLLQTNILVNTASTEPHSANGVAHTPALSTDGRYIAFVSDGDNLVTNSGNGEFQVFWRDLVTGTTRLVSRNTDGGAATFNHEFVVPTISGDGLQVAFESGAADIIDGDLNQSSDVFLYNSGDDSMTLVSRSLIPSFTPTGFSWIGSNPLTADGHTLVFSLGPHAQEADGTIVVHDIPTGTNLLIRDGANRIFDGEPDSSGRYITYTRRTNAFSSLQFLDEVVRYDLWSNSQSLITAGAFVPGTAVRHAQNSSGTLIALETAASYDFHDGNSTYDIYLYDSVTGTNKLVSYGSSGSSSGGISPLFSSDGTALFFLSGDSHQLFLKRIPGSSGPILVSHTENSSNAINGVIKSFAVSEDSQIAVFATALDDGSLPIYRYDINTGSVTFVCEGQNGSLDHFGQLLAYESPANALSPKTRRSVFLRDLQNGQTTLLSSSSDLNVPTNTVIDAWNPLVSTDGRFILFLAHLGASKTNVARLFARDRAMNRTLALSPQSDGIGLMAGNAAQLTLSRNGRMAVFQSFSDDLAPGDYNDGQDIFLVRFGSGDSDGDGMDDDWEIAYFGNLSRDGWGDFDGDGQTDLQEFRAGTDPTNNGSVLRAITVTQLSGRTSVFWNAVAGRSYRVEFKQNVDDAWTTVSGQIQIKGSTGSIEDTGATSDSQRFYRVVAIR